MAAEAGEITTESSAAECAAAETRQRLELAAEHYLLACYEKKTLFASRSLRPS
jgi:hypothetical protein